MKISTFAILLLNCRFDVGMDAVSTYVILNCFLKLRYVINIYYIITILILL